MTRNDDFTRRLENYLDEYEGVTPLPDAVRAAIRAELPHTKQIGPIPGLSRFSRMTLQLPVSARYGLAAAAVLAAVVVGASIVGGRGSVGDKGNPAHSSAATASPTATPAATGPTNLLDLSVSEAGDLPAGEYYLDLPAYPARIGFQLPAGWWHYWPGSMRSVADVHAVLVNSMDTTGTSDESGWGLAFTLVEAVPVDPCDVAAGYLPSSVTKSAERLTEALGSGGDFLGQSRDVTMGTFSGKSVQVIADDPPCEEPVLFTTPSGYEFAPMWPTSGTKVNQFILLDVEGSVLVIWTTDFPATTEFEVASGASPDPEAHVEDQAQLHDILDSIVIEPR
jgi:hypothetical protein